MSRISSCCFRQFKCHANPEGEVRTNPPGSPSGRADSPSVLTDRVKAMAETGGLQKLAVRMATKGSPLGELSPEETEG